MFTDYSYEAIGVPRNRTLAANADPQHFDLGLCGPPRADHLARRGQPTRSAGCSRRRRCATSPRRKVFFHNGVMHSLEQAVRFYATRDTRPELWYPTVGGRRKAHPDPSFPTYGLVTTQYSGGTVQKFDDLPAAHRGNIDAQMPLDGRARGREAADGRARRAGPDLLPRDAHRWLPPARDPADRRALRELR